MIPLEALSDRQSEDRIFLEVLKRLPIKTVYAKMVSSSRIFMKVMGTTFATPFLPAVANCFLAALLNIS
jgi:hypothetical protein